MIDESQPVDLWSGREIVPPVPGVPGNNSGGVFSTPPCVTGYACGEEDPIMGGRCDLTLNHTGRHMARDDEGNLVWTWETVRQWLR